MARAYTVAAVAITLKVPQKWLDNVLSHHSVPGVSQGRQGVLRRLSPDAITILEVALLLKSTLGSPVGTALHLASELVESGEGRSRLEVDGSIHLSIDLDAIRRSVSTRLADAVEVTPTRRRGRPAS